MSIWYYYYSIGQAGRATTAPVEKLYNETEQGGGLDGLSWALGGRCEVFLYGSKVLDRLSLVTMELQDQIPDIKADNPVDKRIGDPHTLCGILSETASLPAITATHLHKVHWTAWWNIWNPVWGA